MINEGVDILDELSDNFIVSSLDTNMARAFPDVRDGLKPGQRACLWEMWSKKYTSNKPHVKSAKISGGVIATWWPHSDIAIYETFARMSQPFINNAPEVDFHGANGNIILGGDAIANQRYTESRLSPIVEEGMFEGINKNSVDMIPNFSEDAKWPKVLPAVFPRLLVNGAQGIGVSISNYWTLHNFVETGNLILEYLNSGILNEDTYYPDFPTGGTIVNKDELAIINKTGKGRIILEAGYRVNGQTIDFYEMPYQVYIEPVLEQIKAAIEEEKISGIKEVYNDSDKKHISLVVVCERGANVESVIESLFNNTDLRKQYNVNQNGIISKTPVLLNLQQVVDTYIEHNCSCINREHEYDLEKAKSRIHILEGMLEAIGNIDEVVEIIRNDKTPRETLMTTFDLDSEQVKAILDMKLARLAKLEVTKIEDELQEKRKTAEYCEKVINSLDERKQILIKRLSNLVKKYGEPRRTRVEQKTIVKKAAGRKAKEVQAPEPVIIALTSDGYIKNIPVKSYRKNSVNYLSLYKTMDDSMLVFFSNKGNVYRVKANQIKTCEQTDKGTAAGALFNLDDKETIVLSICPSTNDNNYVMFSTKNGIVKKTALAEYDGTTQNLKGLKGINLKDDDELVSISLGKDDERVMLISNGGYTIMFESSAVSYQGKSAGGVRGINLSADDYVVKSILCNATDPILVASRNGNCKVIPISEFNVQGRGGKGQKCAGEPIASILQVSMNDSVSILTEKKRTIVQVSSIKVGSRLSIGNQTVKENILDIVKN